MDPTGITWLDWVMAGMTIFGFALTGYGLLQTWKQARHAKTAADSARSAVTATRSRLMAVDLVNEFAAVRTSANHVVLATESNNPEVAKFALVQLADAMRRAVTLAREPGSPEVDDAIIAQLDSSSRNASVAKAELAKRQAPKVRTYTQDLLPALADLNHSLLEFETAQKYVISEGD